MSHSTEWFEGGRGGGDYNIMMAYISQFICSISGLFFRMADISVVSNSPVVGACRENVHQHAEAPVQPLIVITISFDSDCEHWL